MKVSRQWQVAATHPCLTGHFPGRPLVPAVVILQRIMAELGQAFPGCRVSGIPQAKFLAPLAPGECVQLELAWTEPGAVRFDCRVGTRRLATGKFQVEAAGESR